LVSGLINVDKINQSITWEKYQIR